MSTQWDTDIRPVLDAVYQATCEHANPRIGVSQADINAVLGRAEEDVATALALENLVRAGYLVAGPMPQSDGRQGPVTVMLGKKAFELVAGWPTTSGEHVLARSSRRSIVESRKRMIRKSGPSLSGSVSS